MQDFLAALTDRDREALVLWLALGGLMILGGTGAAVATRATGLGRHARAQH